MLTKPPNTYQAPACQAQRLPLSVHEGTLTASSERPHDSFGPRLRFRCRCYELCTKHL